MKNLAGDKNCDQYIKDELKRACIDIVENKVGGEVPYTIEGKLGELIFRRAWYYWVVIGDVPMDIAKRIYKHPEGKATVRAGGHCGCEPPESQSDYPISDDGLTPISQESMNEYSEKYPSLWEENKHKYRVATKEEENNKVVNCYHIDSQAGLLLFSQMVSQEQKGDSDESE
jgi:hypothetical protein